MGLTQNKPACLCVYVCKCMSCADWKQTKGMNMAQLDVQMCPETGICSVRNGQGEKIDMISTEVADLKAAAGDVQQIKALLAGVDKSFSESLTDEELIQLAKEIA